MKYIIGFTLVLIGCVIVASPVMDMFNNQDLSVSESAVPTEDLTNNNDSQEQGVCLPILGQLFPPDNPWNTDVSTATVDSSSASILGSSTAQVLVETAMPINVVCGADPTATFKFKYPGSDLLPYPAADTLVQESGPCSVMGCLDGKDHHLLTYDAAGHKLYELYNAYKDMNNVWQASSGAIFDTTSNALRPEGSGSSDAAGLPVIPGLVRCDEVKAGEIKHALRITMSQTFPAYVHPATHFTHTLGSLPMGAHLRLKASVDITKFSAHAQVILKALQHYGAFVADNGTPFGITGEVSQSCWVDLGLSSFVNGSGFYFFINGTGTIGIHGSDFELLTLGMEYTTEL